MPRRTRRDGENGKLVEREAATSNSNAGSVEFHVVDVAPLPIFAGLEGLHDGVVGRMIMFGGVLVLGTVAAAHVAAGQAQAKVNPAVAHLQTLLASGGMGLYVANLIDVRAGLRHGQDLLEAMLEQVTRGRHWENEFAGTGG
jgi:hypothetical protein